MEASVVIAEFNGSIVVYQRINDCYECPYNIGDKLTNHKCDLTDEFLHEKGKVDIDVTESCPFPTVGSGISPISAAIVGTYPGINETNLQEIEKHIKKKHSFSPGFRSEVKQEEKL